LGFFSVADIHAEAAVVQVAMGLVGARRIDFVILPSSGFVSNFEYEILIISSVCVTLFTIEDEVSDEAIPEGFKGGKIVAWTK